MKKLSLLLLAALLSSCSQVVKKTDEGTQAGILHVGNGSEPISLDPQLTNAASDFNIVSALMEGLLTEDPDTMEILPGVAERWEVSDDGLVYTFYLRDAKWSNGDPITADDFVYSYQRMLHPALGAEYAYMLYILKNAEGWHKGEVTDPAALGVKAVDPRTLELTLGQPAPYFLSMMNHCSWYPVHPATVEQHGNGPGDRQNRWPLEGNYVGNGPFVLKEWIINEHVVLEKNPNYWGVNDVKLNGIVYYPIDDMDTENRMFRAGQLHLTDNVPVSMISDYVARKDPAYVSAPFLTTYYYLFNTTKKPFDDVRVRKAMSLAMQRGVITDQVLKKGDIPAQWFTPKGTAGFEPEARIAEDVEEAKRLLAEAGFANGEGFPSFELLYNNNEMHKHIATVAQQMWKQHLGIDCTLQNKEWKIYMLARQGLDYDVARAGWTGDFIDPHNFLDLFLSTSGNNNTGWSNDTYDAIINEAAGELDQEKRFGLYAQAEEILLDEMPVLPIYWYVKPVLKHEDVQGWEANLLARQNWRRISLVDATP